MNLGAECYENIFMISNVKLFEIFLCILELENEKFSSISEEKNHMIYKNIQQQHLENS